jgi:hypothetical protein
VADVLRQYTTNWLTGGFHFLIVAVAAQANSARAWPYALTAMTVVSFCAWMANYRRYRQVDDVPTSKVASAAQGYVELFGKSAPIPDSPVLSPLSSLPCCWYRYCIERKGSDDKWHHEDSGVSIAHFLLVDDTGECIISPDGAEVLYPRKSTWTQGDHRYTEWLLLPQGTLYALGEFRTTGGADLELDANNDISNLLADWKTDQPRLLEHFDTNRDGTLDLNEWEAARREARREVENTHADLRSGEGVNVLGKPADGRLFLLAAEMPAKIGRRFAFWSGVHLLFFFGAGTASYLLFFGAR